MSSREETKAGSQLKRYEGKAVPWSCADLCFLMFWLCPAWAPPVVWGPVPAQNVASSEMLMDEEQMCWPIMLFSLFKFVNA